VEDIAWVYLAKQTLSYARDREQSLEGCLSRKEQMVMITMYYKGVMLPDSYRRTKQ